MRWVCLVVWCVACLVYCEEAEEDYASYANLYPEISKKIGEEPIEIIDVVKAILVYDSDNDSPAEPGSSTPSYAEHENATESETESFGLRLIYRTP